MPSAPLRRSAAKQPKKIAARTKARRKSRICCETPSVRFYGLGTASGLRAALAFCPNLLEQMGVPALVSWAGADMVDSDHRFLYGRAGVYGQRAANFVLQNSDFVLAIGTRLALPQVGYDLSELARGAEIAVVDIDRAEAEKHGERVKYPVVSDAKDFIIGLLDTVKNASRSHPMPIGSRNATGGAKNTRGSGRNTRTPRVLSIRTRCLPSCATMQNLPDPTGIGCDINWLDEIVALRMLFVMLLRVCFCQSLRTGSIHSNTRYLHLYSYKLPLKDILFTVTDLEGDVRHFVCAALCMLAQSRLPCAQAGLRCVEALFAPPEYV